MPRRPFRRRSAEGEAASVRRLVVGPVPASKRTEGWPVWNGRGAFPAVADSVDPPAHDIVVASPGWVRQLIPSARRFGTTTELTVRVETWTAPYAGWVGRPGFVRSLRSLTVEVPERAGGALTVRIRTAEAVPVVELLQSVLVVIRPELRVHAPGSAEVGGHGAVAGRWVDAATGRWLATSEPSTGQARVLDALVVGEGRELPLAAADAPAVVQAWRRVLVGPEPFVGLDSSLLNPVGRELGHSLHYTAAPPHRFEPTEWGWRLRDSGDVVRGDVVGQVGLTDLHQRALRRAASARIDGLGIHPPHEEAALLVGLAACGVPITLPGLPAEVAALIAPELRGRLTEPSPVVEGAEAELAGEVASLRLVRAAVRGHDARLATARVSAASFPGLPDRPTVSVVLLTRRAEWLAHAVRQVRRQNYPDAELVLGLHGFDVTDAELDLLLGPLRARTKVVRVGSDVAFGTALGLVSARADGALVTKMDDDDWYAADHLWDLVVARQFAGAEVVSQPISFLYREEDDRTYLLRGRHVHRYWHAVAGGAMLISRGDLDSVGGWRPLDRAVDVGLVQRIARAGGLVYRSHGYGFMYNRRPTGHTWSGMPDDVVAGARAEWPGLLSHEELGTADEQREYDEAVDS